MKDSYGQKLWFGIDCLRNAKFCMIKKMNKIVEILKISIELIMPYLVKSKEKFLKASFLKKWEKYIS